MDILADLGVSLSPRGPRAGSSWTGHEPVDVLVNGKVVEVATIENHYGVRITNVEP